MPLGKQYIGCIWSDGKTLEQRFDEHCKPSSCCRYLRDAIAKRGREWFRIEQIDCANTLEELWKKERCWIDTLKTQVQYGHGYNLRAGGGPQHYEYKHDTTTKEKIAAAITAWHKENPLSAETRKKLSDSLRSRHLDPQFRAAVKAAQGRADVVARNRERNSTPEVKAAQSARMNSYYADPQKKERQRAAQALWRAHRFGYYGA